MTNQRRQLAETAKFAIQGVKEDMNKQTLSHSGMGICTPLGRATGQNGRLSPTSYDPTIPLGIHPETLMPVHHR